MNASANPVSARNAVMLQQARSALREWRIAVNGDSADAEYTAAVFMEQALHELVKALS